MVKIPSIAILIPCYNEESTIFKVVSDFKKVLPQAKIYVYDNFSTDDTARKAKEAGASVIFVRKRGKGNVVRKMFSNIDADLYLMTDGDGTYNPNDAIEMLNAINQEQADMVVAVRKENSEKAFPLGHKFGNFLFNKMLSLLFGSEFQDVFSGYRAFSKRFVKTFPITSDGFDIEAELSIHALTLSLQCVEIESAYCERPPNSVSKLNTITDGVKILFSVVRLLQENRPLLFFGSLSILLCGISMIIFDPILRLYLETGLVPRVPTLLVSVTIMIASLLSFVSGLILSSLNKTRIEIKKLHYLSMRFKQDREILIKNISRA
ncbi:MAG: glycosyltransferase [Alphaproteobacteria bacterium]|nr:glycosyltransferase [Alphaproteobacteria bacterium]